MGELGAVSKKVDIGFHRRLHCISKLLQDGASLNVKFTVIEYAFKAR